MAFREIINQMIDHLGGPPPPGPVSAAMLDDFKQAIDLANECRGDPRVLFRALQAFAATGNEALFAAGVAYVQYHGAYIQGITYDRDGMEVAGAWLRRAEAQDAGIVEFSVIRAFIEIHSRELAGVAELLEDVRRRDPVNYYALTAELEYYAVLGKLDQMMEAFERALPLALSATRRAYLYHRIGRYNLYHNRPDASLDAYRELSRLTPDDPWMWHNMSIILFEKKRFAEARQCNAAALELMDFEAARRIYRELNRLRARRVVRWLWTAVALAVAVALAFAALG